MLYCSFLLMSLAWALCLASPVALPDAFNITEERKGIPDINEGLNLREGDIMMPRQKSAILGNLWVFPVSYELSGNLDLNAKGVILRAFEQFRLKSCIDFKPRAAEDDFYISVQKLEGCWSYVGRIFSGGQNLSIGSGCEIKAIVEHEFLHALGFWHEQSRYDRDDYVTIVYENIIEGYESNFDKYSENMTTTQGTPYDYYSLMHYGKYAFTNGSGFTIITKRPEFQDVIGQRLDLSEYDAIELNKRYKCNSSVSFLDHCSFDDESLCQMSVCSSWQRVKSVNGINVTVHTYLGQEESGTSFFMHFSTEGRNEGDTARMESRTMTPKRDCKVQCLQFYYYHSADESDQLNIWIREYQNEADDRGSLRLMDQITEAPGYFWKLHHVPLNANKSFQVVFVGRKGAGNSSGGFSLDDINISETECPLIWQIRDFEEILNKPFTDTFSPLFYSINGYRFQSLLRVFAKYLSIYIRLVSGENDDRLQWPYTWRQITFQILDQNPHIQKCMSYELSFTTDCTSHIYNGCCVWDNPRNNGTEVIIDNETVHAGIFWGYPYFITIDQLTRREFMKGGDLIFLYSMQDISGLLQNDSLPCTKDTVKNVNVTPDSSVQQRPCVTRSLPTPPQTTSTTTAPETTEGSLPTSPQTTSTTTAPKTTEGSLPTSPQTTSTTTAPKTTNGECLDIICSSSGGTASSLLLLVICFLL